jgi:hypothetical protein
MQYFIRAAEGASLLSISEESFGTFAAEMGTDYSDSEWVVEYSGTVNADPYGHFLCLSRKSHAISKVEGAQAQLDTSILEAIKVANAIGHASGKILAAILVAKTPEEVISRLNSLQQ